MVIGLLAVKLDLETVMNHTETPPNPTLTVHTPLSRGRAMMANECHIRYTQRIERLRIFKRILELFCVLRIEPNTQVAL